MTDMFFYGTMRHAPLRFAVLQREVSVVAARLDGYAVYWAQGHTFPLMVESTGAQVQGVLARNLSTEDMARLDFYEGGFGYGTRDVTVDAEGPAAARVYLPDPGLWEVGPPWHLADWEARWGSIAVETAGDFMALFGERPPSEILPRYYAMLVRGASRVRARTSAPTTLRRTAQQGDIAIARRSQPYANFFAVEEYDLTFRKFDGSFSPVVNRAVFLSGDAVTVLPYDPIRDRVLLIEQFRVGPMARGDAQPWNLETIAGRIDPGESPEACARREAGEEAGLDLGALVSVGNYYPTLGAKSEFIYSYVALTDLPDGSAGVFGMEGEAEDIRGHLVPFDTLMALVSTGEVGNAPLLISALWLARERPRLRAEAEA